MTEANRGSEARRSTVQSLYTRWFAGIYLAGAAGVFANLLGGGETGSSSSFIAVWLLMYALSLPPILARGVRNVLKGDVYIREVVAVTFCALVLSSFLWSKLPAQSFRYSLSLVFNVLFAWYCARSMAVADFFKVLLWVLNIMIFVGLLLGFVGFHNALYIDPDTRSNILGTALIQGLFSHKIYAGYYSAVAMTLNIVLLRGWARLSLTFLALLGVAVSGSSIGIVAALSCMIMLIFLPLLRDRALRVLFLLGLIIALSLFAVFIVPILEAATSALGRDMTFTGRTDIWSYAIRFWSEKPLFGWGYGGIFGSDLNAPGRIVVVNGYYQAPHFHDVYLQVAAELGAVGIMFFISIITMAILRTLDRAWGGRSRIDAAAAAILIVGYLIGMVMNIGLRYNELTTILIFFFFFSAPRVPYVARVQPRSRRLYFVSGSRGQA